MEYRFINFLFCDVFIIWLIFTTEAAQDQTELKFLTVIFRHGDRTPTRKEIYPNDPNYNHDFFPDGFGQLTNNGKRRVYNFGQLLRERYNDFLGDTYTPFTLEARSTNYDRTKMSLQLVLAGLYPPKNTQMWSKTVNWQPIPTTYVTVNEDWLLKPRLCPEYKKELMNVKRLPEVKEQLMAFQPFMDQLTKITGENVSKHTDFNRLYHALTAEAAMDLTLPDWTKDYYPVGKLFDGTIFTYNLYSYTSRMKRLNGGKYLHEIIRKMLMIKDDELEIKISIYSAHEDNIASILAALGIFKAHVPSYANAIVTELREMNNQYYIQVYYYNSASRGFELQIIPGCETLCPLDEFIELLEDVTPSSDELMCNTSKIFTDKESVRLLGLGSR